MMSSWNIPFGLLCDRCIPKLLSWVLLFLAKPFPNSFVFPSNDESHSCFFPIPPEINFTKINSSILINVKFKTYKSKIFLILRIFTYLKFRSPKCNIMKTFSKSSIGIALSQYGFVLSVSHQSNCFISNSLRVVTSIISTNMEEKWLSFLSKHNVKLF